MALIYCPECHNSVSTGAETCPHCGYPIKNLTNKDFENIHKEKKKRARKSWLIIVFIFLLISCSVIHEKTEKEEHFKQFQATVPTVKLSINELIELIDTNEAKQYREKYIEVTGIVVGVDFDRSFNNNVRLNKRPRSETLNADIATDIYCFFEKDSEIEKLKGLQENEEITIVGYCDELFNGKHLKDCFVR